MASDGEGAPLPPDHNLVTLEELPEFMDSQEIDWWEQPPEIEVVDVEDSDAESVNLLLGEDSDDEVLLAAADDDLDPPDSPGLPVEALEPVQDYLTCNQCAMPYDLADANDHNMCRDCRVQRFLYD
jgi:hypothetical protein